MNTNTLGVSCGRILESVGMRNLVLGCAIASLFQMGVNAQAQNVNGTPQSATTAKGQMYRGVVIDDEDQPLLGVSVKDKHGKTLTLTDQTGEFRVMLPAGETTLTFTYVGMKQQKMRMSTLQEECHTSSGRCQCYRRDSDYGYLFAQEGELHRFGSILSQGRTQGYRQPERAAESFSTRSFVCHHGEQSRRF